MAESKIENELIYNAKNWFNLGFSDQEVFDVMKNHIMSEMPTKKDLRMIAEVCKKAKQSISEKKFSADIS